MCGRRVMSWMGRMRLTCSVVRGEEAERAQMRASK
jgi:hypothetical protein